MTYRWNKKKMTKKLATWKRKKTTLLDVAKLHLAMCADPYGKTYK
jgi:hypothetical protein